MANILYHSVHEILEHDELNLLYELGHNVCTIGTYLQVGEDRNNWRPKPNFGPLVPYLMAEYISEGQVLTQQFVDKFDAVMVMHDLEFIARNWQLIRKKKVIWRTIGQWIDEEKAAQYRQEGLLIVGWSKKETLNANFLGRDAVIYSFKDEKIYGPWTGSDGGVLTFSNAYKQRYPLELQFFQQAVVGLPNKIGGGMNDDVKNAIGLVDFSDQIRMYAGCGVYFYAHGSNIPYTLNFIEALMSGAPLVAIGPGALLPGYNLAYSEVFDFIEHGVNGFLADTPGEANELLRIILASPALAKSISVKARASAVSTFGKAAALLAWKSFFESVGLMGSCFPIF